MRYFGRRLAVVGILLCALSAEARERWVELRSPNFLLVSNAAPADAESILSRIERFRIALSRVLPERRLRSEVPTQIYAFRDFDSFESFLPRTEDGVAPAAGYFRAGAFKNVIAVDVSAGRGSYERVVFHEYVHLMLSLGVQEYPLWFEEGLAEFYAATRLSDDGAEVGAAERTHRLVLAEHPLLEMEELLGADETWPLSASPRDQALFYAQSWALVHYLVVGQGLSGRRALSRYLGTLGGDADPLRSFDDAFGKTPAEVGEELRDYLEKGQLGSLHYPLSLPAVTGTFALRELSRAEVQLRWGELFLFTGRMKEARMCLDEACRLDPELGAAWETRGLASLLSGERDQGLRYLKRAIEVDGASPKGLYEYARALLQDHSGQWIDSVPASLAREVEGALRRSLELKPDQSETARLLAFVYLVRGERLLEAKELVESALELTPERPSLLYLYAQLLLHRGDYDRARQTLERLREHAPEPRWREATSELLTRVDEAERAPAAHRQ